MLLRRSLALAAAGLGVACGSAFVSSTPSTRLGRVAFAMSAPAAAPISTAASGGGNALLDQAGLPRFTQIEPAQVEPAISSLISTFEADLKALEADLAGGMAPTWESVVERLEKLRAPLEYSWGVVNHLMGVSNSDALREAHAKVQPAVVKAMASYSQSAAVYRAFQSLRDGGALDGTQARVVEASLREMELSGVGLEGEAQAAFNKIKLELAELSTTFSNNVLDATKAFKLKLTAESEVSGFPDSLKALTAAAAKAAGEEGATADSGPWLVTLDMPCYMPLMQNAADRNLREKVYRAFTTRAGGADGGPDNTKLVSRILELRSQMARMLGKGSYAEVSLAAKMAGSVDAVNGLLDELRTAAFPAAQRELQALQAFAAERGQAEPLALWDVTYWSERRREALYAYSDEELRQYLPLDKVLTGLFGVIERLFDVSVVPADGDADVWHPDVRFFHVRRRTGSPGGGGGGGAEEHVASFFLDPYARPAVKRGGAWMDVCVGKSKALGRKPVAYLTCNGSPPVGDTPSLMAFRDVETLFHEMGHGLQHMLTAVEHADAAGINGVEWDAVELPSQFMENWVYHKPTVDTFAAHYKTGEALPGALFDKVVAARHYNAGLAMLRQLFFAKLDLALHSAYDPASAPADGLGPFALQAELAKDLTVLPPLPEDRFLCAFSHIFAGGYAAGYYSYKWAEVMAADAFGAFEESGLDDDAQLKALGRKFRDTVLGLGGSRHPAEVFEAFRGRQPSPETLLRQAGLVGAQPAAAA